MIQLSKVVVKGREALRKSTAGWDICCRWKDGFTLWKRLSNLNESHPLQVAKCAIDQGIKNEPAFNWWVHHVLKKRDIVSSVKGHSAQYLERTHKFGIELPKMVEEPAITDEKNRNTLWKDPIVEEMENVKVTYQIV